MSDDAVERGLRELDRSRRDLEQADRSPGAGNVETAALECHGRRVRLQGARGNPLALAR